MNNAVLYMRFSSHAQNEASIEGQRKECLAYARQNNYNVIEEYIDRAISGKTDNRPDFLRMIEDSKKKHFQFVIVYQLDRFARSREDSAHYKAKLKKNDVKVLSAKENISQDASGILMEAVLEGMAEYYSAELSQKIRRGMDLKADRCLYTGGSLTLGYKIRKEEIGRNGKGEILYDNHIELDPIAASMIRKIFEMYAARQTITSINEYLNAQQIKTIKGGKFNKNSLRNILQNRRYIGIFTWKGKEVPGGIPRIVSDELFNKVQAIMEKNKSPCPWQG